MTARVPGCSFRVGGSVRDELLGQTPGDHDWVVVGASPQAMVDAGFKPVGKDFPVFLHPHTGEEYALARTERKSAPGYHGFTVHAAPGVTLEEDLARRDLTINAMARDAEGRLIDPFGGARDLAQGVLRHVSPAFVEDPVRLLRLARFAARWPSFTVAPETQVLLKRMVDDGEVSALVPERVWQELARGLMETRPSRMFAVIADSGAWPRLLRDLRAEPELAQRVDTAAARGLSLSVRFAALACHAPTLALHLKAPHDVRDLAAMLHRELEGLPQAAADAESMMALFDRCDAWRRPARVDEMLMAAQCVLDEPDPWTVGLVLRAALARAQALDLARLTREALAAGVSGLEIGARIHRARMTALAPVR